MTDMAQLWTSVYIVILAAFTGYVVISRVPAILHTPLMSGSNFIHGIVLVGAMVALGLATTPLEQLIGFVAVILGAANVTGGYVVTERILQMFDRSGKKPGKEYNMAELSWLIDPVYIVTIFFFIIGMQRMSHPLTARSGIVWAGAAMLIATLVTFFTPNLNNLALIAIAIVIGGGFGYIAARRVAMTDMPQMIALYNGMGGGAAAGISAVALLGTTTMATGSLAVVGGLIGAVSFSGSIIAFLKLQGWMQPRPITFPGQQIMNMAVFVLAIVSGMLVVLQPSWVPLSVSLCLPLFFILALGFGLLMTLPIGGADMPVVISMYNAFTGLAVALDGFSFATPNYAMVVAGIIVGAAGSLLTLNMAKAMNRSISNVFFGAFGASEDDGAQVQGSMKPIESDDVAVLLAYADKVIIAPGYGMAVAQAQQKVKELTDLLESRNVQVKFAIHPVAGRMPGHMNVLLAEAGVAYDRLFDRDEINPEFPSTDVVLVIGANDTVNPAAHRQGSPLFGMPILDVEQAKNVIVLKRGQGKGFAGIENDLFYRDNTRMLYGDAQETVGKLVQAVKKF